MPRPRSSTFYLPLAPVDAPLSLKAKLSVLPPQAANALLAPRTRCFTADGSPAEEEDECARLERVLGKCGPRPTRPSIAPSCTTMPDSQRNRAPFTFAPYACDATTASPSCSTPSSVPTSDSDTETDTDISSTCSMDICQPDDPLVVSPISSLNFREGVSSATMCSFGSLSVFPFRIFPTSLLQIRSITPTRRTSNLGRRLIFRPIILPKKTP